MYIRRNRRKGSKACVWEQLSQYARSRFRQMAENPAESARSAAPWQAALRAARLAAEGDPLWPRLEAHLRARHWALWPKASLESVWRRDYGAAGRRDAARGHAGSDQRSVPRWRARPLVNCEWRDARHPLEHFSAACTASLRRSVCSGCKLSLVPLSWRGERKGAAQK